MLPSLYIMDLDFMCAFHQRFLHKSWSRTLSADFNVVDSLRLATHGIRTPRSMFLNRCILHLTMQMIMEIDQKTMCPLWPVDLQ